MNTKLLYKVNNEGKYLVWSCWAEGSKVVTKYGQEWGKIQLNSYTAEAKNVGRSNATTPEEQALLEVSTAYTSQVDNKHYRYSKEEAEVLASNNLIPRKIHDYKKHAHKLPDKCYSLFKYNGSRACVIQGSLYSKIGRKERIKVKHLRKAVEKLDTYGLANFDAEVYAHGLSLQRIRSAWLKPLRTEKEVIKMANDRLKVRDPSIKVNDYGSAIQVIGYDPNEDAAKLRFYIFDIPVVGVPFETRRSMLTEVFEEINTLAPNCVKLSSGSVTGSPEERLLLRQETVSKGYEGLVHYSPEDIYEFDKRSYTTLKDKPRYSAEALVLGCDKDKSGQGVLRLQTTEDTGGVIFKGKMKGDASLRAYENQLQFVGKWVTYEYEELSDSGTPTKPIVQEVRECNAVGAPLE